MILGGSSLQLPAILVAHKLGLETIVVDYDANCVGHKYGDKFYNTSTLDYEGIKKIALKEKIDGIITICSDRPMTVVGKIGEELGLNTISYTTSIKCTDKFEMREALNHGNVPIPAYKLCKSFSECQGAVDIIGTPCILKPVDNSGSRGVTLVERIDNLKSQYEYAVASSNNKSVLVEEYMQGPEVSVEVVVDGEVNIIQITDKITSGAPHFVELGHNQPSSLPMAIQEEIRHTTEMAVRALGIDKGPAHVELIVTKEGPKIVEVGARLGGDYISTELTPLSTGYNMVEAAIEIAMGFKVTAAKTTNRFSAIRYWNLTHEVELGKNVLTAVEKIYISPRKMASKELESSSDRECFFIVSGDTKDALDSQIYKMESNIK